MIEVVPKSEPSTSKRVDVPSSAEEKKKGVVIDDYESGSDIDPKEERIFGKWFTRVELRKDGSSRFIAIPLDYDLLTNIESMVPSLVPLCSELRTRVCNHLRMTICR